MHAGLTPLPSLLCTYRDAHGVLTHKCRSAGEQGPLRFQIEPVHGLHHTNQRHLTSNRLKTSLSISSFCTDDLAAITAAAYTVSAVLASAAAYHAANAVRCRGNCRRDRLCAKLYRRGQPPIVNVPLQSCWTCSIRC
jgi:hypothetical protein